MEFFVTLYKKFVVLCNIEKYKKIQKIMTTLSFYDNFMTNFHQSCHGLYA